MPEDIRCPECGSETVIRTAKKGPNVGHSFYVCTRYPECIGKLPIPIQMDDEETINGNGIGLTKEKKGIEDQLEDMKTRIQILYEQIVEWADTTIGDGEELMRQIKPLLMELAERGGKDVRHFILHIRNGPHYSLTITNLCDILLEEIEHRDRSAAEKKGEYIAEPAKYFRDHHGEVYCVAFSPDGKMFGSAGDRTIVIRRLDADEHFRLTGHTDTILKLAFSPQDNWLASGSKDNTVRIWDIGMGKFTEAARILTAHEERVSCIAFHPDGTILASADFDQTVKLWEVSSGIQKGELRACEKTWQAGAPGELHLAFSRDGDKLLVGGVTASHGGPIGVLKLLNFKTGASIWSSYPQQFAPIFGVSFSPDGKVIAVADEDSAYILDAESGTLIATLREHRDFVNAIDFSPDGRVLATGSGDKQVIFWDLVSMRPTMNTLLHGGYVLTVKYSPDGKILAVGDSSSMVTLWDLQATTSG